MTRGNTMRPDRVHHDPHFVYQGYWRDAFCRVEVFRRMNGCCVVVMTELDENTGTSVTNACEKIATKAALAYGLPVDLGEDGKVVWVEHYPQRGAHGELDEVFARITFADHTDKQGYRRPHWQHLSREAMEDLIGEGWY